MKILKENKDISNDNRAYYLYSDILEINIERIIKTIIMDLILRDYLNSIKELFNVLIR